MKKIILILIFFSGLTFAQDWDAKKLGTGGKYRAVSNNSTYLSKTADSVYAALYYIVNLDSISQDVRIDSIKSILNRLETYNATANTYLDEITEQNEFDTFTLLSGNTSSLTQLASLAVKEAVLRNETNETIYYSFDGSTEIKLYPQTSRVFRGMMNMNKLYIKGNYKIEVIE